MWRFCSILIVATIPVLADEIGQAVRDLGAPEFAVRQAAQGRLAELGDANPDVVLDRTVREFAVATDPEVRARLRETLAALVEKHIYNRPRGFLGIQMAQSMVAGGPVQAAPTLRILVSSLTADSAAEKAGVQAGDQITGVDGRDVDAAQPVPKFTEYIRDLKPGTPVKLRVQRADQTLELPVTLGEMPADMRQRLFPPVKKDEFFGEWLAGALEKIPPARQQKIDKPRRAR